MKEATGELNMTVITIVAIGAILAFFYAIIWPTIKTNMALTSACNASGGSQYSMTDKDGNSISCDNGQCTYTEKNGTTNSKDCGTRNDD